MPGNTFGTLLQITTWGESHGPALGVVIDGCPPGFPISVKDIQKELNKRRPGQNAVGSSRKEQDHVEILSGIFEEKTSGTPISLMIRNKDQRSKDYSAVKNIYRPGHADLSFDLKYGFRDYRGGGRSSGRETAARVMAGAIAKKYLKNTFKTKIIGHTKQVGEIKAARFEEKHIEKNNLRCADPVSAKKNGKVYIGTKKSGGFMRRNS